MGLSACRGVANWITWRKQNVHCDFGNAAFGAVRADCYMLRDFGDFDLAHVIDFTPGCTASIAVLSQSAVVAGLVSQIC